MCWQGPWTLEPVNALRVPLLPTALAADVTGKGISLTASASVLLPTTNYSYSY